MGNGFYTKWRESTLTQIDTGAGEPIYLRTAHQENFIYVLIDEVSKTSFDKHADIAVICFDKNGNQSAVANENDYCFGVPFDSKNPFTLRGGSLLEQSNHYTKIKNSNELIGISNVSDENDRYTAVPHASYEFRIPTDLVGRSDTYGVYSVVYDAHTNKFYAWPSPSTASFLFKIPLPASWGEIVSPDKSLPELSWPTILLLSGVLFVIYVTKIRYRHLHLRTNGNWLN
ncbi:MAG: hypothetical protein AUG16_03975 [Thaumarchaeota archaeon 13_1_20CM_2_39_20]|nr:MAG: hypothetical protein AUG16_03975 [Thaumarchaeota archaeon 13_1_20CM_2_39_20]